MNVRNPLGLSLTFTACGALQRVEAAPICIAAAGPSEFARSTANLFLRERRGTYTPLLGLESPSRALVSGGRFEARGSWSGIDYVCSLAAAPSELAWEWRVSLLNSLSHPVELDLIYVQHVRLKCISNDLVNESYVGQYIERRVLEDPRHGRVICCRQNMREAGGNPWLMIACANRAIAASTDGLSFYGRTFRTLGVPEGLLANELSGELSGESAVAAIQEQPFVLSAGESKNSAFIASYVPDHPGPSSEADLARLPKVLHAVADARKETREPETCTQAFALPRSLSDSATLANHLRRARLLQAEDLSQAELEQRFGRDWRHTEELEGELLSFFAEGPRHIVLRAKETRVDRPHGHIMQANTGLLPDEAIMSTTAFACGVFNSHLTQGNTNFNTLLSVCGQPATPNLEGQRIIVQLDDGPYLLGTPSAFEMGLQHCRWIYKFGPRCLQVCTWASPRTPEIHLDVRVLRGEPLRLWLTHQFDPLNDWQVHAGSVDEFIAQPRPDSMLGRHFPRARFRLVMQGHDTGLRSHQLEDPEHESSTFVLEVPAASAFSMTFVGELTRPAVTSRIEDADVRRRTDCEQAALDWHELSRGLALRGAHEIRAIDEVLPWFGMNALVHYLTPYGLEQFSGAAWGTRDVCQGPIDLLLCQEKFAEAKEVLRILFSRQDPDGGWPQWWMFDRYASVRADSAHGDVIYWCILALCSYLKASCDLAFLDEPLPYYDAGGASPAPRTPVSEHVDRIIGLIGRSFVAGTALVRFGGGDWNDSLQPVSADLARRMISSWTVQMSYQAVDAYREACERAGRPERARELGALAARIHGDFQCHLVRDGVVAGYGLLPATPGADLSEPDAPDGSQDARDIELLLHPSDVRTCVHYSLLPMNRGVISGAFTKEQSEHHLALIERHLKGPDGARLMDRPLRYHGGMQTLFQRAESSTFFGREIGLMYMHEHLRYAEALACMGHADAFLHALRQAIPVDYRAIVPQGDLRQANCYYSSSDVLFRSRFEADERYADVVRGALPLQGGWRVYSSGPGIYIGLVITRLLGLRIAFDEVILDPVLARGLDGLTATLRIRGRRVHLVYRVQGPGFGPQMIAINGLPVAFDREPNPYRLGGARMPLEGFLSALGANENTVEIRL